MSRHALLAMVMAGIGLCGCASPKTNPSLAFAQYQGPADPDTVTCRRTVRTGTRIPAMECRSNRAWMSDAPSGRAYAERMEGYRSLQLPE